MKPVTIIGSLSLDLNLYRHRTLNKLGGVVTYAGKTFAKHQIQSRLFFNLSEQDIHVMAKLRDPYLQLHYGYSEQTTSFVNDYRYRSRRQQMPVQAAPICLHQIGKEALKSGFVYLGPLHPADIALEVYDYMKKEKLAGAMDIQGLTRKCVGQQIENDIFKDIKRCLEAVQIIKAKESELSKLLEVTGMSEGQLMQQCKLDELIITGGHEGSLILLANGRQHRIQASGRGEVVDLTGAGDVYFAAYLSARFYRNKPPGEAGAYAAEIASLQVAGKYIDERELSLSAGRPKA